MATIHVKAAATGGGNGSSGFPYTLQEAFDNVAAGDEIRVWADSTYSVGAQIDIDTTAGTAALPIVVNGANASGTVDGTRPVLQASAAIGRILYIDALADYYRINSLDFDGNSNATAIVDTSNVATAGVTFHRCKLHGATGYGLYSNGFVFQLFDCDIYGNGSDGCKGNINLGFRAISYCRIHDNGGVGVALGRPAQILAGNHIYDNGGHGIVWGGAVGNVVWVITENTVYGNGGSGLYIGENQHMGGGIVTNNSFVANGAYGVALNAKIVSLIVFDNNHTHGNTSGACDGTLPGSSNQTGDPLFASVTDGSEDFTPGTGSPLLAAGLDAGSA